MVYEFKFPDIGEGVAEGEVVQWFVKEGEAVKEDDPLVSVLTDKANVEIPSPRTGKILKLHAQVGEKVKVGAPLVTFGEAGETVPELASRTEPPSIPNERVASPSAEPGSEVAPRAASASDARILTTPYLRRLAIERGIDLRTVRGTGPGGRITESDVIGASAAEPRPAPSERLPPPGHPPEPVPAAPRSTSVPGPLVAKEERIHLIGIRRVIAEHMTEATHRAAHYTYVEEVDATELVHWRDRMAKHVEKGGVRLSYLPFIIRAVTVGLKAYPWMNARMDDEKNELVVYGNYNVGIAMAAPEGLIVPVIRDADKKSVNQLAKEIQDLSERGRAGKLQRSELIGGTFTITSLGALGGVMATPILNYPEVAILGVHKIVQRPVYRSDGTVGPAQLMNLSVSIDHRVLDGIVAAQFVSVLKSHLEDPHQLFAELA